MFWYLRGIALIAAVVLNCGITVAEQDENSEKFMVPACRAAAKLSSYEAPKGDLLFMPG
jgi:hypothetical protein